jgi:hypothetical protein
MKDRKGALPPDGMPVEDELSFIGRNQIDKSGFNRMIFEQMKLGPNTNEPLGPLAGRAQRKHKKQR